MPSSQDKLFDLNRPRGEDVEELGLPHLEAASVLAPHEYPASPVHSDISIVSHMDESEVCIGLAKLLNRHKCRHMSGLITSNAVLIPKCVDSS